MCLASGLYWRNEPGASSTGSAPTCMSPARAYFLSHEVWGPEEHLGGLGKVRSCQATPTCQNGNVSTFYQYRAEHQPCAFSPYRGGD